jgi:predicted helicase
MPEAPFYFLSPHTAPSASGWFEYKSLEDIFSMQSAGMVTARDDLNIAFDKDSLLARLRSFAGLEPSVAREKFHLGPDTRDWKIGLAQKDLSGKGFNRKYLRRVAYRPFDERFVFYTGQSKGLIGQPGKPLAEAIELSGIALGTIRRVEEGEFRHALVYALLPDGHSVSSKETTHVFPLFLPKKLSGVGPGKGRIENITSGFRDFIDSRYDHHFTPQEIFGYIYAVLYAPTYRSDYAEFLRSDFPRVPFPDSADDFEGLSKLGWALVQAHLLRELLRKGLATYDGKGDHTVEAVRYSPGEKAVSINKTQSFKPVPQAVWDFHIGGYQVLDKYLKSRKGRALSLDEINHVGAIADSLAFTIEQVAKIDEAYQIAFAERG